MESANVPPDGKDYWDDEDPEHPVSDWKIEVRDGNTRAGYWEWVYAAHSLDSDLEGEPEVGSNAMNEDELVALMLKEYYVDTTGVKGRMRRVIRLLKEKGLLQVKEETQ